MLTPIPTMSIISSSVPHIMTLSTLQILIFIFHSSTEPNPVSSQPENYLTKYPHLFIQSSTSYFSFKPMHLILTIKKKNEFTHSFFHTKKKNKKSHAPSFPIHHSSAIYHIHMHAWVVVCGYNPWKKNLWTLWCAQLLFFLKKSRGLLRKWTMCVLKQFSMDAAVFQMTFHTTLTLKGVCCVFHFFKKPRHLPQNWQEIEQ